MRLFPINIVPVIIIVTVLISISSAVAKSQGSTDIFMPLVIVPPAAPQQLGEVTIVSGPTPCDTGECYTISVSCSQLAAPQTAIVKVGAPSDTSTPRGTIAFATGWIGNYLWEVGAPSNSTIISDLRAGGFQTVQIQWQQNWFLTRSQGESLGELTCRPATVLRWIYDNLHTTVDEQAFCATGHSNGASQLAYSMVRYGLSDILSMVLFESGPNWSRVDYSCILDPDHPELFGDSGERNTIDWAFGYPNDGTGACARSDTKQINNFRNASLADSSGSYVFPNTMVVFAFGDSDTTVTASHGKYFYQELSDAGTPLLSMSSVPGAPHYITEVPAGAELVRNQLLTECRVR